MSFFIRTVAERLERKTFWSRHDWPARRYVEGFRVFRACRKLAVKLCK